MFITYITCGRLKKINTEDSDINTEDSDINTEDSDINTEDSDILVTINYVDDDL